VPVPLALPSTLSGLVVFRGRERPFGCRLAVPVHTHFEAVRERVG